MIGGLNTDKWHSVMVRIDVHGARLIARVDEMQQEIGLQGLQVAKPYGITYDLTSVVLIGGESSEICDFPKNVYIVSYKFGHGTCY